MSKLRLGVIGIGNMGRTHIMYLKLPIAPNWQVTAVADINPKKLEWATKSIPSAKQYSSGAELISEAAVDAVLIAVPHFDHCELAIQALEKNIHTMVEKPAGVYSKQVHEMNAAAEKSDAVFAVMFNQRTNPVYKKMREIVQSGEMGEIVRVNWIVTDWYRPQAYYNSGDWRATWKGEGGGVLLNQCPHNLDLWQWICGMPSSMQAEMKFGGRHKIEVEDEVTAVAKYENGATAVFIASTGESPGTNRFEITLDGGKLVSENGKLTIYKISPFEPEFSATNKKAFGKPKLRKKRFRSIKKSTMHPGVMNAFAKAIMDGTPLVANGIEGINSLLLSNSMHFSAFLGGKEVPIPFDDDEYYKLLQEKMRTSKRLTEVEEVDSDMSSSF